MDHNHNGKESETFESEVTLTAERYKDEVLRGDYSRITEEDILFFESVLGTDRVCRDSAELESHNIDYYRLVRGQSQVLLKPRTTSEISSILKHCNERRIAVCPQGGNTGLVFGSVPIYDEIILSTSLMNNVISFDEFAGVLVSESGCTLDQLSRYVELKGYLMPLDLAPKDLCQIGGNVSTNAGGLRLFRYGSLHSTVLGLEIVLANGEILDCLSTVKKDNTGYDLKHLFIGSEGTLGFLTKVAIQCPPQPEATAVMLLGMTNFESILSTFRRAKLCFMEALSCCEYIDGESMRLVQEKMGLKSPTQDYQFYILLECSGSDETEIRNKMKLFIKNGLADGVLDEGIVAESSEQAQIIWTLRKEIGNALPMDGYTYKYDFSIPLTEFHPFVEEVKERIKSTVFTRCCGFGHMGDSNIHLTVTSPKYDPEIVAKLEPFVYEWVARHRGSVSAEHGLGFKEKKYISYSKSIPAIGMMRKIKELFDPNNILNPYKVLPDIMME